MSTRPPEQLLSREGSQRLRDHWQGRIQCAGKTSAVVKTSDVPQPLPAPGPAGFDQYGEGRKESRTMLDL